MLQRIVVVGASLAGLRAAEALRREGFAGGLILLGSEAHPPYDRPPLSKQVLSGQWPSARAQLRSAQELADSGIELRLSCTATSLDAQRKQLALADGSTLAYDGLVIATGTRVRTLPFGQGLSGMHVLRTLDDSLALHAALASKPRVCVIGAGFIGLEVAACCIALGTSVSVIEPLALPLLPKIGERMAQVIAALHRARGVDLRLGVGVSAIEGEGRVERVRLSDGSLLAADLVVVGVGVQPAVEWLRGSGVELDDGVVCDATCATALPDVVAAGDCARWPNARFGERMRIEHWSHAGEMAAHAARRLVSGPSFTEPFSPVPYFWSDQYELKLQFAGRAQPDDRVEVIEGFANDDPKGVALYGRGGQLIGVLAIGKPAQLIKYRKAIADGVSFEAALGRS